MKGNSEVMAGLQEAVTVEATLMLQYLLDQRDLKRLGLDLADGFKLLHEQCEDHMKCLTSRLLFLEGAADAQSEAGDDPRQHWRHAERRVRRRAGRRFSLRRTL